jgi:hypothetical protein
MGTGNRSSAVVISNSNKINQIAGKFAREIVESGYQVDEVSYYQEDILAKDVKELKDYCWRTGDYMENSDLSYAENDRNCVQDTILQQAKDMIHWSEDGRAVAVKWDVDFILKTVKGIGDKKYTISDGATVQFDSHAATIIDISDSGKVVTVQMDKATRTDDRGVSESQEYEYERNPNGQIEKFSLRKNGRWVRVGDSMNGTGLIIGVRGEYYDFSF